MKLAQFVIGLVLASTPFVSIAEVRFTQNAARQTVSLSGLFDDNTCVPRTVTGVVVKRKFNANEISLEGVVLESKSGIRTFINTFAPAGLDIATARVVNDGLQRLTRQGRVVTTRVLECGAGGGFLNLESIR